MEGKKGTNTSDALARAEIEISKRTPRQSMTSGSLATQNGTFHAPKRRQTGLASTTCDLGKIKVDADNSTEILTKYKLNESFVTGGGDTELVTVDNLTATIGNFVWLAIAWTATGNESTVDAGGTMGTITVGQGAEIPTDTIPEPDALTGIAHIVLGGWINVGGNPKWIKQGCGSIQVYFCPGNGFIFGRNNDVEA